MKNSLVSIIIPVYNSEKYLEECINSVINQTWPYKEIIIIDDGSTDNSLIIAKKFESETIKIYSQTNKGASSARNFGLKKATGSYIQFLDADDTLSEKKIELQMGKLNNTDGFLAICKTVHFMDGSKPSTTNLVYEWIEEGSKDPVDFLIKLYGGGYIGKEYGGMIQPSAWLSPKSVIEEAGLWNENLTTDDDGEFFCRVVLASNGIVFTKDAFNYYRKFLTKKSLSNSNSWASNRSALNSINLKKQHILKKEDSSRAKLAISRLYWELAVSCFPRFMDLFLEAKKAAKTLSPDFKYSPYNKGLSFTLSKLVGWKLVRFIKYYKNLI